MFPRPLVFQIPGRTVKDVTGQCGLAETTTILAGMPHMHEIGKGFEQTITRANGDVENLISLQNWDFESQLFYRIPITLEPGDVLNTTCTFDNPNLEMVTVGPNTSDEMCFNFMYVTPPLTSRYCDEVANNSLSDVTYAKGMCAPESALENPELVQGRFVVGVPEALGGGVLEDGVYELSTIEIWRQSAQTPVGDLDLERSKILARGQLIIVRDHIRCGYRLGYLVVDRSELHPAGEYLSKCGTQRAGRYGGHLLFRVLKTFFNSLLQPAREEVFLAL